MNILPRSWRLPLAVILILSACCAQAQQQRPLTGTMAQMPLHVESQAPSLPAAAAPLPPAHSPFSGTSPAPRARNARSEVGDTTRALLRMQAEGTYAGRALPVLGDQASRSYRRYLDSFEHPIPERFELTVRGGSGTP